MKSFSIHYVFTEGSDYKDLAPVFPDIIKEIIADNDHFTDEDGEEQIEMFVAMNMADLELNRKPVGYNRKGKYRLMFPMDRKEFYILTHDEKAKGDIKRIEERISEILSTAKGIHFYSFNNQLGYGVSGYDTPGLLVGVSEISVYEEVYLKKNQVRNEKEGTFIRVDANCDVTVPPKGEVIIDGSLYVNTDKKEDLILFVNTNAPNRKNVILKKGSVQVEEGVVITVNDKQSDGQKLKFSL